MNKKVFIINGIGKCGTRLVHGFLKNIYYCSNDFNFLVNISDINNCNIIYNSIYKTHSPFPEPVRNDIDIKMIYMFGNIMNTVLSFTKGKNGKLGAGAVKNLHIDLDKKDKKYNEIDLLNYTRHIKNWNKPQQYPIMILRYENLYSNLEHLLKFMEVPENKWKKFPKFKERTTDWTKESKKVQDDLWNIYGESYMYANKLPDLAIWLPKRENDERIKF